MARVKRFIYNSDFMTIAHTGRETITFTIPAGQTDYSGTKEFDIKMPEQSWARVRVQYRGTNNRVQDLASSGFFYITATKNGKNISYLVNLSFKQDKLVAEYYVNNVTDSTVVSANAQTVTLIIDFLRQPNT